MMPALFPLTWLAAALAMAAPAESPLIPGSPPASRELKAALVEDGLEFPIFVTSPPGDTRRLFILERKGRIWLRKDGKRLPEPFLDVTPLTGAAHEFGVYSVAFHPKFETNRRFFIYYVDNNGHSRLAEFRAAASLDQAEPLPVRTILSQQQASYCLHYGGLIAFGPDGRLYVGLGDGQTGRKPSSPSQDTASLLGKMLRLDVDAKTPYAAPPDNPFAGRPEARGEIWMTGLRNPWRWSFDRESGDLWIADVGEDKREEVTRVRAAQAGGANLGWPAMEGTLCFRPPEGCDRSGLPPVHEYDHTQGCSVTGGYVYRGKSIPELRGTYFYADYCTGWVRSFRLDADGRAVDHASHVGFPAEDNPNSFGEDAGGEMYVTYSSGKVYRIERASH